MMQYIVPIPALFQGRIIDKSEQSMMEIRYSARGEVEHQVSTLFDVCEF